MLIFIYYVNYVNYRNYRKNYRNSDCPYIFESQTGQQLRQDFDDDEITEIRTVHSHF